MASEEAPRLMAGGVSRYLVVPRSPYSARIKTFDDAFELFRSGRLGYYMTMSNPEGCNLEEQDLFQVDHLGNCHRVVAE